MWFDSGEKEMKVIIWDQLATGLICCVRWRCLCILFSEYSNSQEKNRQTQSYLIEVDFWYRDGQTSPNLNFKKKKMRLDSWILENKTGKARSCCRWDNTTK